MTIAQQLQKALVEIEIQRQRDLARQRPDFRYAPEHVIRRLLRDMNLAGNPTLVEPDDAA